MNGKYNEKMIRKQIIRAREHSSRGLFERKKTETSEQKLTLKQLTNRNKPTNKQTSSYVWHFGL